MEDIPPDQQLIPDAIDYRAQHSPDRTYIILPKGEQLQSGFESFNYRELAKAVNAAAWWLDGTLGKKVEDEDFPTIPYLGPNDIRYALIAFACVKTRRKMLNLVPANTPEGIASLLKETKAKVVLAARGHQARWRPVLKHLQNEDVQAICVPDLSHFIHDQPVEPYRYLRKFHEALDDPVWVMQTAGTTGNPKPIFWLYRNCQDYINREVRLSKHNPQDQKLAIPELFRESYMPNFLGFEFAAGFVTSVIHPLGFDTVPIIMPTSMPRPITPEYISQALKHVPKGEKNGIIFIPDVLRAVTKVPGCLDSLKKYDWIMYAGGPLDAATGDMLTDSGIRVQSLVGSTETSIWPFLLNDPTDWRIHRLLEGQSGCFFQKEEDGLFELCIRKEGPTDPRHCFAGDSEMEIYHTRDLWRPVDGREGFMEYVGRVDDFVRLTNWTRLNAISMEATIDRHPNVERSMCGGTGRPRPFAIVQLKTSVLDGRVPVDAVWPAIEEANEYVHEQVRIMKELVLTTSRDNPIPTTTVKGSVDRRKTLKLFESEIEQLYKGAGFDPLPSGAVLST